MVLIACGMWCPLCVSWVIGVIAFICYRYKRIKLYILAQAESRSNNAEFWLLVMVGPTTMYMNNKVLGYTVFFKIRRWMCSINPAIIFIVFVILVHYCRCYILCQSKQKGIQNWYQIELLHLCDYNSIRLHSSQRPMENLEG